VIENIDELRRRALDEVANASDAATLEAVRVKYLGRKGAIRRIMSGLAKLAPEERKTAGQRANEVKSTITKALEEKRQSVSQIEQAPSVTTTRKHAAASVLSSTRENIDVTLPGTKPRLGRRHPVMVTFERLVEIFERLGFSVEFGPEVELDYYNFDALNVPDWHLSRHPRDNFYIDEGVMLRTQTSTVQPRVMERMKPPVRIIAPGRVYRPDTVDATHSFMFHQLEGFMVDRDVTFADLKTVLTLFAQELFRADVRIRLRPHFFPFTEPSAEVDVSCTICGGDGCRICKGKGWIEIAGCGMIDPNVFEKVGYDPDAYTGFAFGMGVDRITMIKHEIDDLRLFFENDIRFLAQF